MIEMRLFDDLPEEKRQELFELMKHHVYPLISLLKPEEQADILEGRCIYRQHEHVPILDYSAAA